MAGVVCAVGIALALWAVPWADSASPYETLHVVHQPVTIGLPSGWFASTPPAPAVFVAYSPKQDAYVDLAITKTTSPSLASFRANFVASTRQNYMTKDPHATMRFRSIGLPGGKGEEAIARLEGQAAYSFGILRNHLIYSFTYVCPISKLGAYLPVFEHSPATIRIG